MKLATIMTPKCRTLLKPYQAALRRYLKQESSASLKPAERLGRKAVTLGLETLDLALIHEQVLLDEVLPTDRVAVRNRTIKRARVFFAEAILPMEESHRTALEANAKLSRTNEALKQRTREISASNRKLKQEIGKRKAVEQALRKSERESRRLLDQSQDLQKQLRQLSHQILSVQEEERKRISRELHDVVAQMLTGINVQLATLKTEAQVSTRGLAKDIARAQKLVEKSVDKVHRFARELRPAVLDDLGLIPALHSFVKGFSKDTGIRVNLTAFEDVKKLSSVKRTVLFRVAQEALTNVARHAQAGRVDVRIEEYPKAVRMKIKDDGKAFDVERMWKTSKNKHLGLLGMRERVEMVGGKFEIVSAPGQGTTVRARIPFNNGKERTRS